jgi:PAS domain S-box-containing protein
MLLDFSRLTPHGFCLAWQPGLIWLEALSDSLIAAAYFSIPAALVVFLRRRHDLAFKPIFGLFAAFILACGSTHIMGALTLWVPAYWLDGIIKAITALLSVATAMTLWPLLPKALALPSPAALRDANGALAREAELSRQIAARLRDSEERQRQLYARTPAPLHAVDSRGIILDVSDRWLSLIGYARHEVIGRPIADFYTAESKALSARHLAAFHVGQSVPFAERRLQCRDGRVRDAELMIEVERDHRGDLQRVLVAVTDVTARKEAEAALQSSEDRLRQSQKMEAVGQLTGGIAHDFNNMLTTIMGSLELLQRRPNLDIRAATLASNALGAAHRATRLTSQLLTFSRRQMLNPETLNPAEVVDGIHDLLARTLGDRIRLHVTCAADQWSLLADRNQVEAALLNLVINARDAIPETGDVTIALGNLILESHAAHDLPDGMSPGPYVTIAVQDTGTGMTEEVRAHAFEPFFTTKPPGAGTGLGLSQIYGFVTQSGGTVRLHSIPGQGTCIEMILPRGEMEGAGIGGGYRKEELLF